MKIKHSSRGVAPPLETFQHTHIAVYLCGFSAVGCVCYDSIQVIQQTRQDLSYTLEKVGEVADRLNYPAGGYAKVCTESQMVLPIWSVAGSDCLA